MRIGLLCMETNVSYLVIETYVFILVEEKGEIGSYRVVKAQDRQLKSF